MKTIQFGRPSLRTIRIAAYDMIYVLKNTLKHGQSQRTLLKKGRDILERSGYAVEPVGLGNSKTELPSTYRPVGKTCPKACAMLDAGCYAQKGRVNMVQVRAPGDVVSSMASAALAMAVSWYAEEELLTRLHVSGDFAMNGDQIDEEYVYGLLSLFEAMEEECWFFEDWDDEEGYTKAFGYTHLLPEQFEKYRADFEMFNVIIRYSCDDGVAMPGGAIVAKDNDAYYALKLAQPDIKFVKCREQIDGTTCKNCKICWEKKTRDHCVVFFKH